MQAPEFDPVEAIAKAFNGKEISSDERAALQRLASASRSISSEMLEAMKLLDSVTGSIDDPLTELKNLIKDKNLFQRLLFKVKYFLLTVFFKLIPDSFRSRILESSLSKVDSELSDVVNNLQNLLPK